MVNTEEDAKKAVSAVKYPPFGKRGVGLARAQGYGVEFERYKEWLNKESIVVAQIEHIDAVNNLEKILKVEGIDATIIGPYDLSASIGYPGEFNKKEVKEAMDSYVVGCKKLDKPIGFHVVNPDFEEAKKKINEGFNFIAFGLDTLFLATKCKSELSNIRRHIA